MNCTNYLKFLILLVGFGFIMQSCGDDDEGELMIPEVTAAFTSSINQDTGTVTFTNASDNADAFAWDFGNNTSSTAENPDVTYTESGTFVVTLIATNVAGGSDTATETIVIDLPVTQTPFDSGLLSNGDFEDPANTAWIVGVDPNITAPTVTEGGNTFYSVDVMNPDPTQPFLVNMSQFVNIDSGTTYRLVFDAWSDVDRNIIAGIGLSGGDFSNNSEMVAINTTPTTYELILCANNFGAPDARVLFDSNGEAGMVGIDNVALFVEDDTMDCSSQAPEPFDGLLLSNGDFQDVDGDGNLTGWIVGVDPAAPAPSVLQGQDRVAFYDIDDADSTQPFAVNMSQIVEIIQGNTYRLIFEAWTDVAEKDIIAGIGLSGGDFSSATDIVTLTPDPTVFTLDLLAGSFGAPDARVLFDLFGEVGDAFFDNISLEVIGTTGGFAGIANGDFENVDANDMVTDWIVGVDVNAPAPTVVENGNRFYSVNVTNPDPGQPFLVNVSQILPIEQGNSFVLEFEAWSDVDRNIIAGIGLSDGDFSNDSMVQAITTTPTVYSLTLSSATFGAANARVLFDLNGEAGMVNIDNVTLTQQ